MKKLFEAYTLGNLKLKNRFVFPPIKTAYGGPQGEITDRQLAFYKQIAKDGPGLIILEPVSVTPEGREHPKQLSMHLPESAMKFSKIVDGIHTEDCKACLHLNHAGAAANPKTTGVSPKAPSVMTCPASGQTAETLSLDEIAGIIEGYRTAAQTAKSAKFDLIEIQAGHGYLVSQFLNEKLNKREDEYGQDRKLLIREILKAVKDAAPDIPVILRISGNEMSPKFGLCSKTIGELLQLAEDQGVAAIHVGMGHVCFSPPWYFHHSSLPEDPQIHALARIRTETSLPIIVAGRMGRREKIEKVMQQGLADLVSLGRPLIADPSIIKKWGSRAFDTVNYCGYCLQGCLHRVKTGLPLGCNLNPELGLPRLLKSDQSLKILIAGGGPAGLSAAKYLTYRGHQVTLVEQKSRLGGQFALAWQAPGKEQMYDSLMTLEQEVRTSIESIRLNETVDARLIKQLKPDLLVWATGAVQNIPQIEGLDSQNSMTSLQFFEKNGRIPGPRVLVIGAGRTGLEIAEVLGRSRYETTATKRTDPIGSEMEMITKKLALKRIEDMPHVNLMPHTTVKSFSHDGVTIEQDGEIFKLEPFQTVILASGMLSAPGPDDTVNAFAHDVEIIGDAQQVQDIYSAIHAGYELGLKY